MRKKKSTWMVEDHSTWYTLMVKTSIFYRPLSVKPQHIGLLYNILNGCSPPNDTGPPQSKSEIDLLTYWNVERGFTPPLQLSGYRIVLVPPSTLWRNTVEGVVSLHPLFTGTLSKKGSDQYNVTRTLLVYRKEVLPSLTTTGTDTPHTLL